MRGTYRGTALPCRSNSTLGTLTAAAAVFAAASLAMGQVKIEPVQTGAVQNVFKSKTARTPGTGTVGGSASLSTGATTTLLKDTNIIYPPAPRPRGGGATDACGSAPVIGYGTHMYDLTGATNDYAGTCGATGTAEDVWYALLAPATETVRVETCGLAGHDSVLEIVSACGGFTIACVDDACALQTIVEFAATAGTTYMIRIADFAACGGCPGVVGSILVGPPPPPPMCSDCPKGGIAEGEPDCGLPIDTVNGGCNSSPPVFTLISVGDTVCGTGAFDGGTRDTDWYQVDLAADTELSWTVSAEFEVLIGMINSPCPQNAFIPGTAFLSPACTPVTSTACLCAGTYYMFVAPNFSAAVPCGTDAEYVASLAGIPCVPPPPPACADCPAGGIPEGEPDCGVPVDTVNGGCNSTPNVFSPIALGDTVCGTGAFDGGTRDTDWYELVLAADTEITWVAQAEFDFIIGTVSSPCPQGNFRVFATAPACGGPVSVTECLRAGTYYLFMAPQFTNVVACGACGGSAEYVATVTGIPCTPPPPPPNDDCANATIVAEGTFPYSNVDSSTDGPSSSCAPSGLDVWFLYQPTMSGDQQFTTCSSARTHDTVMSIYDMGCGGFELGCNDDGPPFCAIPGVPFSGSTIALPVIVGNSYLVQIGSFGGGATGSGELTIGPPPPPPMCADCPVGGIAENELDCGLPTDSINGGCNSSPPVFSPIALGDTVCGTGAFDTTIGFRDTDWWRFTLDCPTTVTWGVQAEFDLLIGFVGQPCPQTAFLAFATSAACAPGGATVTMALAAGTYVAFAAPQFTAAVTCGPARYVGTLTGVADALGACCIADSCTVTSPTNCAALGGTYQGDCTACPAFDYTASTCNDAFEDISASGTPVVPSNECDDCFAMVPIGFSFSFYGSLFTDIFVSSNGQMTFGVGNATFGNVAIPNAAAPNNMITAWWDDLWTIGAGNVQSQTLGVAPNRRFIAQWTNVEQFPGSPGNTATFQAILFEGSNEIDFRYTSIGVPNDFVTVGVENATGTAGTAIDYLTITTPDCRTLTGEIVGENPCDACPCDFNNDNVLNSQDFFDFLACFFVPLDCPPLAADYNNNGIVDSQDFFDFLECFFIPPAGCLP